MVRNLTTESAHLPEYSRDKLVAAILYFLRNADNGHLGKTKLMKLLYYADFDHMERFGRPITGARYLKFPQGPVPSEAFTVLQEMEAANKIQAQQVQRGVHTQTRYDAIVEPDVSLFSASERLILKRVVSKWADEPLSRIVAASHSESPWMSVKMGSVIPYSLARYRSALNVTRAY